MINIDLVTKSMKKGTTWLIKNGKPVNGYVIPDKHVTFDMLETLYATYKTSVPDNIHYEYNYFKAYSDKELDVIALATGSVRKIAKENLETMLLIGALNGSLTWPDDKHWFWQSKKDTDFVILKEWVVCS